MVSFIDKTFDNYRGLLFGLLANCMFAEGAKEACPLADLRNNLTTEEKYDYVMKLRDTEVKDLLKQHEECYQARLLNPIQN